MCINQCIIYTSLPTYIHLQVTYRHTNSNQTPQGHPGGDVTPLFIPKDDDIYPTLTLHSPSTQARFGFGFGLFGSFGDMCIMQGGHGRACRNCHEPIHAHASLNKPSTTNITKKQVLGRFCSADILHPHRALIGAPPGAYVFVCLCI